MRINNLKLYHLNFSLCNHSIFKSPLHFSLKTIKIEKKVKTAQVVVYLSIIMQSVMNLFSIVIYELVQCLYLIMSYDTLCKPGFGKLSYVFDVAIIIFDHRGSRKKESCLITCNF